MITCLWALLFTAAFSAAAPGQEADPALQALVERFFATQQAEDVEGYLALWSRDATKPTAAQLAFLFNSGDDTFTDVRVDRARVSGDSGRLRVSALRARTNPRLKTRDGASRVFNSRVELALSVVREDGNWKILREGSPAEELALALIDEPDASARLALMKAEPELLNARLVDAIARRADGFAQREQYAAAQAMYERSLEVAEVVGDSRARGQALQNIANSLYFQRNFAGALDLYERRLAFERELANDEGVASALVGKATVLYSTHDYGPALSAYREALAIQERLDDLATAATTLISTGNVLYLQGDYDGAIADYRRAETLKRKYFDFAAAATALEGLGRVHSAQGDHAAALHAFAGVLEERRRMKDRAREAMVLHSIGEIHLRLGNTDAARTAFAESRQRFDTLKHPASAGRALLGTALTELVAGRMPAAEKAYNEGIAACTAGADPECIGRAQVGLGFALAAQDRFDDAVTWYGRSMASFQALKMDDASARARIGMAAALSGRGQHDKALEQAAAARRTAVALESEDLLWRALVAVSRAERKLARPLDALNSARAAVATVERIAAAALARPGQAAPRDGVSAYAVLAVLQSEQGDGAGAFATAEAMRAHALRTALAPYEREISREMTDEERVTERTLTTSLLTLIAQHDRQRGLPRPDGAQIEKLAAAIETATAQRTAWREKLFARVPPLRVWRGLAGPADAGDLARLLEQDGRLLLQFVVDEHDLVVITAARDAGADAVTITTRAIPIERQTLAKRVAAAVDPVSLATVERWRVVSAELFALLPDVIMEQLTAARSVVVVPDDILWRVPFEAMPVKDQFLADLVSVSYATSVAAIALTPSPPGAAGSPSVVAVAAPQLPSSVVEALESTAPTWTLRSAEAASAEVAQIAAPADAPPPVVLSGAAATKEAVKAAVGSAAALHIAAPFRLNSAAPLFSPVLLAEPRPEGTPAPARDTELETREVFDLASSANVVMISDPSALSMRDAALGIAPLHWAWRATGATALIVRRWGGDERLSNQFVKLFYEYLGGGRPAAVAFDAARAAIRTAHDGRAPAAWAGWLRFEGR